MKTVSLEIAKRMAEAGIFTEMPCDNCGGEGRIPIGKHYVTLEMAIDAGDRSLEGQYHSTQYAPCEHCEGAPIRRVPNTLDEMMEHELWWRVIYDFTFIYDGAIQVRSFPIMSRLSIEPKNGKPDIQALTDYCATKMCEAKEKEK